jgi:hypothetical protein
MAALADQVVGCRWLIEHGIGSLTGAARAASRSAAVSPEGPRISLVSTPGESILAIR